MKTRMRWVLFMALAVASTTGCHRKEFIRDKRTVIDPPLASADPALTAPGEVTFVDRHPMFRKPVEYYESSGPSPIRKMAAATIIGVPAGILGEMRQVVVGCPPGF